MLLYDKNRTRTDVYKYQINSGGSLMIEDHGEVVIIFVNGVFERVNFSFSGAYTRNQWRIIAEINKEIESIEIAYKTLEDK